MRTKITYYLGAGASYGERDCDDLGNPKAHGPQKIYGGLPIVNELPLRVERLKSALGTFVVPKEKEEKRPEYEKLSNDLRNDISMLEGDIKTHASIDTLARKFYLNNETKKLSFIKFLIDILFTHEQYLEGLDPRYDLLFATLLEKGTKRNLVYPENISFISWNYDLQIENALYNFNQDFKDKNPSASIETFREVYYIFFEGCKVEDELDDGKKDLIRMPVFKLNGTAGRFDQLPLQLVFMNKLKERFTIDDRMLDNSFYIHILDSYSYFSNIIYKPSISFAWEKEESRILKKCLQVLNETDILVVIGYSFPTFNRKIDRLLLERFSGKIYLQVPLDNYEQVRTRIEALAANKSSVEILPVKSLDEFYIPPEFD